MNSHTFPVSADVEQRVSELLTAAFVASSESEDVAEWMARMTNVILKSADLGWQEAASRIAAEESNEEIVLAYGPRSPFTHVSVVEAHDGEELWKDGE